MYSAVNRCGLLFLLLLPAWLSAQSTWVSTQLQSGKHGKLQLKKDSLGNRLPDFSRVGYHHQQKAIPLLPVREIVLPGEGSDQERIQAAIDRLAERQPDQNGFRGAVLLKAGTYEIPGTLKITASGIVLRGEGEATRLMATGKGKRDLIAITGKGNIQSNNEQQYAIADNYVPVGATSFMLTQTRGLNVGDPILLVWQPNDNWVHAVKMDEIERRDSSTKQWTAAEYELRFERRITAIKGNRISIDNPVMQAIDRQFGKAHLLRYEFPGRISETGVEDIYCASAFTEEEDEDHAWVAIYINRAENGWVRRVKTRYFGYAAVNLGQYAKNISVVDCQSLDPKSKITGSRRYSFNVDGQQNLVMDCFASRGRHDYITGARVCGPNVFYRCRAVDAFADIGPHHRWSVGTLYDNIHTDGEINIQDRGNWGTGHGWAGVTQVLWNCHAKRIAVQSPWASGKNYAIGVSGSKYTGRLPGRPDGVWEGINQEGLNPASLFEWQSGRQFPLPEADKAIIEVKALLRPQLLERAALAVKEDPVTVTATRSERSAGGLHDFFSEGDYWWPDPRHPDSPYIQKDGLTNPGNFTAHREAMVRFSEVVGILASAWQLTGNPEYVAQALRHCRAWFIDSSTRMNPSLLYAQAIKGRVTGRGIGIIDTIHLMEVVQGLLAMKNSPLITRQDWLGFKTWFRKYLQWLTSHPYGIAEMNAKNNHGTCWTMQVAVFARFTGNDSLITVCRNRFKEVLLPQQMAANGSFPLELQRTKPYGYSIFNLDAMTTICQQLSTATTDLWHYKTVDGRSILNGVEFLYPYICNKESWPYTRDLMHWEDWPVAPPFLLFAALQQKRPDWLQTWKDAVHFPTAREILRNLPVRNPLLWINAAQAK